MALFLIFHATNIAILCYICVNAVLNIRRGVAFFEKMAGIFGGRNEKAVFVKKGEAPPPIEQTKGRADGTFEEMNIEKKESSTEQSRAGSAEQEVPSRADRHMKKQQSSASLHLFSIGNYFHRVIPSD